MNARISTVKRPKSLSISESALAKLRDKGFRITGVRKRLVSFIMHLEGHWTIQDLAHRLEKEGVLSIGQASLYRTVKLLEAHRLITETRLGADSARYEVNSHKHHDHLTCLDCGLLVEFENSKIEALQSKVASSLGFVLTDHRMELFGRCQKPRCERKVTARQRSGAAARNALRGIRH